MAWLRAHRRRWALFSVLMFTLHTLVVSFALPAGAASTDGSGLVPICTSKGVQLVAIDSLDGESAPAGHHYECPLCLVGCLTCAPGATLPALIVVLLLEPLPAVVAVGAPPHVAGLALRSFSRTVTPRAPPALG